MASSKSKKQLSHVLNYKNKLSTYIQFHKLLVKIATLLFVSCTVFSFHDSCDLQDLLQSHSLFYSFLRFAHLFTIQQQLFDSHFPMFDRILSCNIIVGMSVIINEQNKRCILCACVVFRILWPTKNIKCNNLER